MSRPALVVRDPLALVKVGCTVKVLVMLLEKLRPRLM